MFGSELITGKVTAVACVVLLLVLAAFGTYHWVYVGILERKVESQANTIADLQGKLTTVTELNKKLAASITTQNESILATQKASAEASALAIKEAGMARAEANLWRNRFTKVISPEITEVNECKDLAQRFGAYFALRIEETKK